MESDEQLRDILTRFRKVVIVGLSPDPRRPSHRVAHYLLHRGYEVHGVNPKIHEVLGRPVYPSLQAVPFPLEIVDVFRRPELIPALMDELILLRPQVIWLQEGVTHPEAEAKARNAGLTVISNRCMYKEHVRLIGRPKRQAA